MCVNYVDELFSFSAVEKIVSGLMSGKKHLQIAVTSGQVNDVFPWSLLLNALLHTPIHKATSFFFTPRLAISPIKIGYNTIVAPPKNRV